MSLRSRRLKLSMKLWASEVEDERILNLNLFYGPFHINSGSSRKYVPVKSYILLIIFL